MVAETKMTITKNDLQKYSSNILGLLGREKIRSISELEEKMGQSFSTPEGLIQLELRPSKDSSTALTISYIVRGKGIPVEVRLNPQHHYTLFMVKAKERIESYNPVAPDLMGNIVQSKEFEFSFEEMLEELKRLSSV